MKRFAGIWIDREYAVIVMQEDYRERVIHVNSDLRSCYRLESDGGSPTSHGQPGRMSERRMAETIRVHLNGFYDRIIERVGDVESIYVFGPGWPKLEFAERFRKDRSLTGKIVKVETRDRMTSDQIVTETMRYFCPVRYVRTAGGTRGARP